LQQHGQRPDRHPLIARVLERPGVDDGRAALRLESLPHRLLDDALGLLHPRVLPLLDALDRGQRSEIARDQGLHRLEGEAPHEDEGEVARVGEAVVVEGQRLLHVHLVDRFGRHLPGARVVARQRRLQRLREGERGAGLLVCEDRLPLGLVRRESLLVGSGRCERQVNQLEHRLEVLGRGAAAQPLLGVADDRRHARDRAREHLAKIRRAELADAGDRHDLRGRPRRHEVLITRERCSPGARRAEHDLVLLERRRLEHHLDAVGQVPLGDPVGLLDRRLDDGAGLRQAFHQGLAADRIGVCRDLPGVDAGHDRRQLRLIGHGEPWLLGRRDHHHAVLVAHPLACDGVHLVQRDARQEPEVQRVLQRRSGNRLLDREVPDELVGQHHRLVLVLLGQVLLVPPQRRALLAIQLGGHEAEAGHPRGLDEQRVEGAVDGPFLRDRVQRRRLLRPHEGAAAGHGRDEGRVGLPSDVRQPRAEHGGGQALHDFLPVDADAARLAGRQLVVDRYLRHRRFLVGGDGVQGAGLVRNLVDRPRPRGPGRRDRSELLLDQRLDRRLVEVADGDDRHLVRAVPVLVEAPQRVVRERLEALLGADGQPLGVTRSLQQDRELLVAHPGARAASLPPLLDDDAALLVDLGRREGQVVRPVFQDQERFLEQLRLVGGNLQHVHGLVEARVGVDARAGAHPDRFHELDHRRSREVRGAVECHVLDEVREPELVLVLEHGPRVHRQAQLGPFRGQLVGADVVAETVREPADGDERVHRDRVGGSQRLRQLLHLGGQRGWGRRHLRCRERGDHQACAGRHDQQCGDVFLRAHGRVLPVTVLRTRDGRAVGQQVARRALYALRGAAVAGGTAGPAVRAAGPGTPRDARVAPSEAARPRRVRRSRPGAMTHVIPPRAPARLECWLVPGAVSVPTAGQI